MQVKIGKYPLSFKRSFGIDTFLIGKGFYINLWFFLLNNYLLKGLNLMILYHFSNQNFINL